MQNCYAILQVSPDATDRQIKSSYRQRVKDLHPDLNHPRTEEQTHKLQDLFTAYRTLLDKDRRWEHDLFFGFCKRTPYRFNFRDFLLQNIDDPHCCAKLIIFDLLHDRKKQALRYFQRYRYVHSFQKVLDRKDYMDFLFLLGEALEQAGEYVQAFLLFGTVLDYEEEKPYFKHFRLEIFARIHYLVCDVFPRTMKPDQALAYCIRALKWSRLQTMKKQILQMIKRLSLRLSPEEEILWQDRLATYAEEGVDA